VDDGREGALGMAEAGEQPLDPGQREVDDLGVKRQQPLEDRVARGPGGGGGVQQPAPGGGSAGPAGAGASASAPSGVAAAISP